MLGGIADKDITIHISLNEVNATGQIHRLNNDKYYYKVPKITLLQYGSTVLFGVVLPNHFSFKMAWRYWLTTAKPKGNPKSFHYVSMNILKNFFTEFSTN